MSLALAVVCTSRLGTWASLQYIFFYRCSCWVDLLQSYVCFKRRILILWGWFLFFDLWDSCYRNCGSARILRKSVGRTFVWPIWPHYHRFAIEMTCSCPSMAYLCHIVEKVLSRSLFRRSSPSLETCRPKILTLPLITDLHLKWPALLVRFQS